MVSKPFSPFEDVFDSNPPSDQRFSCGDLPVPNATDWISLPGRAFSSSLRNTVSSIYRALEIWMRISNIQTVNAKFEMCSKFCFKLSQFASNYCILLQFWWILLQTLGKKLRFSPKNNTITTMTNLPWFRLLCVFDWRYLAFFTISSRLSSRCFRSVWDFDNCSRRSFSVNSRDHVFRDISKLTKPNFESDTSFSI